MRALILDDNPDDRELAARALHQAFPGLELVEVGAPAELERALEQGGFDFAVTDYQLRWTDGLKVLERLTERWPELPVVMFTNTGSEEVAAEGMKRGLADYVIKRHGQYQRLAHAVRNVLERHELRGRVGLLLAREREAREEAERASRLKEEFLATLSHELRTPLHAVLGWTHLLRQESLEPEDRRRAVEVIERNARAQAQLIEDLLDLSRLETGRLELALESADLGLVAQSAIAAVAPTAQPKGIEIRAALGERRPPVRIDPARMRQVALNLLTNAIKFSPAGSCIEVRVAARGRHAILEVADQGEGIAADFLPHVFERFRQRDGSSTRRSGGLGIGLALVKKLVEAHQGTVSAESAGPGRGALFTVRLPLANRRSAEPAGPRLDRSHPPSLKGVTVLAIDDEEDGLEVVRRVLEHCDGEVRVARDAKSGLALLRAERPGVVVCDIGMPGTDGYQFIEQVRALSGEAREVPAIALTALARAEDRERALLAGFDAHLAKPVDTYELLVLVAKLAGVLERARRCEMAS